MFSATIEFISLVSSNSLLVFCFCNLIIIILLFSNSKSDSTPSHSGSSVYVAVNPKRIEKEQIKESEPLVSIDIEASSEVIEKEVVANVPTVDKEPVNEKIDDEEDEDEDELRKRVEEFIAKINTAWKAEKLGNFAPYVHREQLHGHLGGTLVM
ncbi:hypothetical protein AQUCO_01300596v1 [Aquilegia coerulea]|uniref:Uncharacterized protein n=1 Tax=Aquilegia coerulea TaxID=218851 RepID=A0A2G5E2J5_AQUCA|nr:hypothetical protein AQUCO_01300596v1 [Aquilegia coerulea]